MFNHNRVRKAFRAFNEVHPGDRIQIDDEHGQTWVTCLNCGMQWSVHETGDGLGFEEASEGDGYCTETAS